MRVTQLISCLFLATSTINAASLSEARALDRREALAVSAQSDILSPEHSLEKRKGGGGKGGGGGGSGGGGKGGGTSGGGRTSSSSNTGGATRSGSGPTRAYGGGGFYGGGASTPYSAGSKTPKGLVAGALILPGAAALFIFPGLWLYSVYPYYLNQYRFYNQSFQNATAQGLNQTLNVTCLCQQYQVCGCDNNDNQQYLHDLVGNGSYDALNRTLVNVADVNGTRVLALNGSLPNGTTAPGGTDDAAAGLRVGKYSGYFVMVMIVLSTIAFC